MTGKAPVPFTRDEIVAYEKGPQTGADPNAGKQPVTAAKIGFAADEPPVSDPVPDPAAAVADPTATDETPPADPSAAVDTDPTASGEDASADTADSATAAADPDSEATPPAADPPPKKGGAQERIEGLASENNALRKYGEHILEYNKRLAARVEELEKAGKPAADAAPAAPDVPEAKDDPMPTMEGHAFDPAAFGKAIAEWNKREVARTVDARIAARDAAERAAAAKRTAATVVNDFNATVAEFKKTTPDYEVVLSNPSLPTLAPEAAGHLIRNKQVDVLYHLAKNPDKLTRISRMDPASQLEHLGRIRAQLDAAVAKPAAKSANPPQKRTTQAPPPPKPVTGSSPAQKQPHEMSMDEFVAADRQRKIDQRNAARARRGLK